MRLFKILVSGEYTAMHRDMFSGEDDLIPVSSYMKWVVKYIHML